MAIANSALTLLLSETSATSFVSASVTPTGDALVLATVTSSHGTTASTPSSVTGNGLTWVLVDNVAFTGASYFGMVSVYRAMGSSPTSGAVTANFAATQEGCIISVSEYTGTDTTGTNGSGAIVQSVTNAANTSSMVNNLATFADANNVPYATCGMDLNEAPELPTGFTTIHADAIESPSEIGLHTATGAVNDNTITWATTGDSQDLASVNIEIAVGATAQPTGTINVTDVDDTLAGIGSGGIAPVTGTINYTDNNDTVTASGTSEAPIGHNTLTTGTAASNVTSFNTASITPSADALILLEVMTHSLSSGGNSTPSVTGNGLTWVAVESLAGINYAANFVRHSVFRAMGASPTTGAITIDLGTDTQDGCAWVVTEKTQVDTSGTNGSGAVVQSTTNTSTTNSCTVTLAAFSNTKNATNGSFCRTTSGVGQDQVPGTGFIEVYKTSIGMEDGYQSQIHSIYKLDTDTTVDSSTTGSLVSTTGIAFEVKTSATSVQGTLNTTDVDDTIAGVGNATQVPTGTIDVTDVDDTIAGVGLMQPSGTLDTTDVNDTIAGAAQAGIIYDGSVVGNETAATSTSTNNLSLKKDALLLLAVYLKIDEDPTSITGKGLTWTKITHNTFSGTRLSLYRAMSSTTPTAGSITINFSTATMGYSLAQYTGTDTTGTNGSGAIAQSTTSSGTSAVATSENRADTLSAFSGSSNAALMYEAQDDSVTTYSGGTGFIADTGADVYLANELSLLPIYKLSEDTSPNINVTDAIGTNWGTTSIEVKQFSTDDGTVTGTSDTTDVDDTIAGVGLMQPSGTLDTTDVNDTLAGAGTHTEVVTGTSDTTDVDDTIAGVGEQTFTGTSDTTDVDDTIVATGIQTISGTINVIDVDDTPTMVGSQIFTGTSDTTDIDDTIAASGTHTEVVTGTSDTTDADDTIAGVGEQTFTGTSDTTDVDDTTASAGTQTYLGTSDTTDVDDTIAGTGSQIFIGTSDTTDVNDTLAGAGTSTSNDATGTINVIDVDDTIAGAGSQIFTGTSDTTDADDTISASGLEVFVGILDTTDVDDTAASAGTQTYLGTSDTTDVDDTTASAGTQIYLGTLDVTDVDDTIAGVAEVVFTGTSDTTDVDDTISASGTMQPSGTLDVTDVDDTIAATGVHSEENTLNVLEEDDTPTMVGVQIFTGTSDNTEEDDISSSAAEVVFTGTSSTTDNDDTIVSNGVLAFIGILNSVDADDTTASAGTQTYLGTSDTTDTNDTLAGVGVQTENPVGTLDTTDVDDTISGVGEQTFTGTVDTTDVDDTIVATGLQTITGTVDITDADDTSASNGVITYLGILNVAEEDDSLAGVGEIGNGIIGTLSTTDKDDTTTTVGVIIPLYSTTVEDITFIIDESADTNVSNFNNINNLFVEDTSIVVKQQTYTNILEECIQGPAGPPGSQGITEADLTYSKRVDFTVDDTIIYKGEAPAGSLENIAVWRVRRLTIAGDNDVTEEWADGVDTFDKIWANRLSITYS